ncbi:alpha/beta hydrolase [Tenacibaculum singaporense]|uniref:alpha/beta hydrolase n=1 Tax=Tenacibaculum singaporense TaxID=2358479 RepID=UPI000F68F084|nr:alpha/beta hydrolase-fold protein [Tenacibaculum singaporense]RSC93060.1 hypothetical protein EI424_11520 [Tenacibaculum singaporense]
MNFIKSLVLVAVLCCFSCSNAQQKEQVISQKPQVENNKSITIGSKVKLYSKLLGEERELFISLPPKYNEHVQDYPVVFVLEAEYLFEATQTITKYMASRSKMPESIVIGLTNGEYDKRHEFNYERWKGTPDKTLEFFKKELIPYIQSNYRVNSHRTIIGLSPTTGFLYQAFLRQPDMFNGYIALSAHLEWDREMGTKIIDEIMAKNDNSDYQRSTFYFGRAESDFPDYPGSKEAFEEAIHKLKNYTVNNVKIKVDIIKDDEHYLMALAGIRSGLEAIYPNSLWRNSGLAGWQKNENFAHSYYKAYYDKLSSIYGFTIYPIENAHGYGFSISGHIQLAQKWGKYQQLKNLALLSIQYFPNSAFMHMALAEAYKKEGQQQLALKEGKKAIELVRIYNNDEFESYNERFKELKDRD